MKDLRDVMHPLVEPHLENLVPYIPGKPIEETEREYGIKNIAKLASNENCLGPSPKAIEAMARALSGVHLYPDAGAFYLKDALVKFHATHGVKQNQVVVGNGTNEILTLLVRAFVGKDEAVLFGWPSFVVYRLAARGCGREEVAVPVNDDQTYDFNALSDALRENPRIKLLFLANPNNPTGASYGDDEFRQFLATVPDDVVVVIDEAYIEYVARKDFPDGMRIALSRPRTVVTRTFSKVYGLAALRIGYAVGDAAVVDILNRLRDPFNTGSLGQTAAIAALSDVEHVSRAVAHNATERIRLSSAFATRGFRVTPSDANFVLAELGEGMPSMDVMNEALLKRGVIVRPLPGYGLKSHARVTVGTVSENDRLLGAVDEILAEMKR